MKAMTVIPSPTTIIAYTTKMIFLIDEPLNNVIRQINDLKNLRVGTADFITFSSLVSSFMTSPAVILGFLRARIFKNNLRKLAGYIH